MQQTQGLFFKYSHLFLQLELLLASAVCPVISSQDRGWFLVWHSVFHLFIHLMSFWSSSSVHDRVSNPLAGCDLSITDFPAEMEEINPIKLLPWNILQEN